MLKLDGSYLEGGGSIARIALALSTITQKPFEIENIRKNRPQAGLKSQHLFCIKALEQLCSAKAEGAFLGSQGLKYTPGKIQAKDIEIDIQTSGSISLFLQSVLMPLMFANKASKIKIIGGTSGKWAAPIEYFKEVFLPQIQKYVKIDLKLIKRGYYPKGNGIVELKSKASADRHLTDQILPFIALFGGRIKASKITNHAKTNIYAIEQFLGKCFEIDEKNNILSRSEEHTSELQSHVNL